MIKLHTVTPTDYFGSNCYIVESLNECIVIDPSVPYEKIREIIGDISIKCILLTHAHFDHIYSINTYKNIPVYVGAGDAKMLSDPYLNCYLGFLGIHDGYFSDYTALNDGDELSLGEEKIKVIATPGHTPGGMSYQIGSAVFVGDTLFENGGYGRCDLPLGDIEVLEKSLIKLFARFRDETFYPGHGNQSTFKETIEYFN